jgi:hypothetical protein
VFLSVSRSNPEISCHAAELRIPTIQIHSNSQRFSNLYGFRDQHIPHGCRLHYKGADGNPIHYTAAYVRSLPCDSGDLSLIGKTFLVTSILENSKVIVALEFGSGRPSTSVIPPLLTPGLTGAIVNHVTTQCQDQGRLLEEAKRDLEVFKKAYYKAERDMHDHEERFEQEKHALSYEIHQLKVRYFQSEVVVGCFKSPRHNLMSCYNDAVMLTVPSSFRQSKLVKNEWWC